jgi:ribose transport system substrate-binding protein
MRQSALCSILAATTLLAACGSDSGNAPPAVDSGVPTTDAAPVVVSPFAPAAIENVIESLVAQVTAANWPSSQKPPIAVLLKDLTTFWAPVVIGSNRMSTRLVTPSVVEAPLIEDPANTSEEQAAVLQNKYVTNYLTTNVYKGMAYAPHAADAPTVALLNEFIAQCGPVVTIDSDVAESNRSYLIATANYQAGATAATKLLEVLTPGDQVVVFGTTQAAWISGIERAKGAEDALAAGGMIVTPRVSPVWDAAVDTATLVAVLSDPALNIKGMVCMYSNSFACAAAVQQTGKAGLVKIVGFDMTADTKAYFDQGLFYAIAVQRQYYMGQLGVLVPYAMNVLGPVQTAATLAPILATPTFIDTGIDLITTANYADYMTFLSTLGINS